MNIYIYIYIHIYIYTYFPRFVCLFVCLSFCLSVYAYVSVHIYIHASMHVYVFVDHWLLCFTLLVSMPSAPAAPLQEAAVPGARVAWARGEARPAYIENTVHYV